MATGEIKVGDLPTMSDLDFTANDFIFIIDNGTDAKKISRLDFTTALQPLFKGEKGDPGPAGATGATGPQGPAGATGPIGNTGATGPAGADGDQGEQGFNGWSPVLAVVSDSDRRVVQVNSWTGGTGTPPPSGVYLGSSGLVSDIALATDIRGIQGLQGATGEQGPAGEDGQDGQDGKTVSSITFNSDLSVTVTYTDDTTITSGTPPKQHGWGSYKDSVYTDVSPFVIATNTQVVLPNNADVKLETNLPTAVTTFYNPTTQKYLLQDSEGFYSVRVRFKVQAGTQSDYINVSMSKDTTENPYSEDRIVRGDSLVHEMNFNTVMYGDTPLSTNGLTIRVKTYSRQISIYNIEVTVAKLI